VTNPNDPTHESPLDSTGFPFREVGLFCDNECDTPDLTADIRADNRAEAFAGLRRFAAEQGWLITPALDLCPACAGADRPTAVPTLTTTDSSEDPTP
jgi:hypothetical protein